MNIGRIIKVVARVLYAIGLAAVLGYGVYLLTKAQYFLGLVIISVGLISFTIGLYMLYGFGELIENEGKTADYLQALIERRAKQETPTSEVSAPDVGGGQEMGEINKGVEETD